MSYTTFYDQLFKPVVKKYGPLDEETITSIIGFTAGGPVSLSKIESVNLFLTCELAANPDQMNSSEGLKYELLCVDVGDEDKCRGLLTALSSLTLNEALGDGHTVDVSQIVNGDESPMTVKLSLFSEAEIDGHKFGIYEVLSA